MLERARQICSKSAAGSTIDRFVQLSMSVGTSWKGGRDGLCLNSLGEVGSRREEIVHAPTPRISPDPFAQVQPFS